VDNRGQARRYWVATLPFLVGLLLLRFPNRLTELIAIPVAAGGLLLVRRHPGRALCALVVLLPLQNLGYAWLYARGVPAGVIRPLGAVKELLGLGILGAALFPRGPTNRRLDRADRLALIWLGALVAYLVIPGVLSDPGYPTRVDIRVLGFRADAGFVLLFLAARHAPIPRRFAAHFTTALWTVGGLVAGLALYNWFAWPSWIHFVDVTANLPRFSRNILGLDQSSVFQATQFLVNAPKRAVSVTSSPFSLADLCLITLGLALESLVRRQHGVVPYLLVCLLGLALFFSGTRADLVGAGVIAALMLLPLAGRRERQQVRLLLVLVAALALLVPVVGKSRVSGAQGGSASATAHTHEFAYGFTALTRHPLGTGLGTAAGTGQRFQIAQAVTSDNSVLQVGNELGVAMMVLFILLYIEVLRALGAAASEEPDGALPRGMQAVMIGLAVVGMLHHVFVYLPVAWIAWGGAGLALGVAERERLAPQAHRAAVLSHSSPG
jgi:hypothetical protein